MKTTINRFLFLKVLIFMGLLIVSSGQASAKEAEKKSCEKDKDFYNIPYNKQISGTWYGRIEGKNKNEYADYTLSLVAYDESRNEIEMANQDSEKISRGMVYRPETQVSGFLTINLFPKDINGNCKQKLEYKIPLKGIFMNNYLMLNNVSYSENGYLLTKVNYMIYNYVKGSLEGHYFEFAPFAGSLEAIKTQITLRKKKP